MMYVFFAHMLGSKRVNFNFMQSCIVIPFWGIIYREFCTMDFSLFGTFSRKEKQLYEVEAYNVEYMYTCGVHVRICSVLSITLFSLSLSLSLFAPVFQVSSCNSTMHCN